MPAGLPDDASLALLAEEPAELLVGLLDVPLFEVSVPLAGEPADLPLAGEPVEAEESLLLPPELAPFDPLAAPDELLAPDFPPDDPLAPAPCELPLPPAPDVPPELAPEEPPPLELAAAVYVNWVAELGTELPDGVITMTGTDPGLLLGGLTTKISASLSMTYCVVESAPKATPVVLLRPEPEIMTCVPPLADPIAGKMLVTSGGVAINRLQ